MYCYWRYFLFIFVVSAFAADPDPQFIPPITEKSPVVKKTLRPWRKWLIGAGAATAGLAATVVLWRMSLKNKANSNSSIKNLTPNNDQRLLGSSVNKPASGIPPLLSDQDEHKITDWGVVDSDLTVDVQRGAAIIKPENLSIIAGFATQGDVLQAQRLLIALPNLIYFPYPVEEVNTVPLLSECVICYEPTNVAYVFYEGAVQRWAQCQPCWHKHSTTWVNGQSPAGASVDNLKIIITNDYVDQYKDYLQKHVAATDKFVRDLRTARDRSFIKNISGDAPCNCKYDIACKCAAYKVKRKEFNPAQLLQEALLVGGMQDASNSGRVVEGLEEYFHLSLREGK